MNLLRPFFSRGRFSGALVSQYSSMVLPLLNHLPIDLTPPSVALEIPLFFSCVRILFRRRQTTTTFGLLMSYCIVVLISSTILTALNIYSTHMLFIAFRNFPGGPLGFLVASSSYPIYQVPLAAYLIGNIASDVLLVCCYPVFINKTH